MILVICKAYAAAGLAQSETRMYPTGMATNKHCREENSGLLHKAQPPCNASTDFAALWMG